MCICLFLLVNTTIIAFVTTNKQLSICLFCCKQYYNSCACYQWILLSKDGKSVHCLARVVILFPQHIYSLFVAVRKPANPVSIEQPRFPVCPEVDTNIGSGVFSITAPRSYNSPPLSYKSVYKCYTILPA